MNQPIAFQGTSNGCGICCRLGKGCFPQRSGEARPQKPTENPMAQKQNRPGFGHQPGDTLVCLPSGGRTDAMTREVEPRRLVIFEQTAVIEFLKVKPASGDCGPDHSWQIGLLAIPSQRIEFVRITLDKVNNTAPKENSLRLQSTLHIGTEI